MIGLLVTVCAISTPALCEVHVRPLYGANELTCLMVGQAEVARTLRPGWRVARFGCTRIENVAAADAPLPATTGATPRPGSDGGPRPTR